MSVNDPNYKVVLYVTDIENDKIVFDKLKHYFSNCVPCKTLKDLCKHLVDKTVPTVFLMTGNTLEDTLINYYRGVDAVTEFSVCEHKVVALIPLKYERDAFEAHRCNAIDDYLISRPLYEANRIVLIVEHLLYELGVSLPTMKRRQVSDNLKNSISSDFAKLMSKLVDSKNELNQAFASSLKEIEECLDNASQRIQDNQIVELDLAKLKETLKQIKSDEVRPQLLALQQKAISLLDKSVEIKPPKEVENTNESEEDTKQPHEFNRLYQQDIDINNLDNNDQNKVKVLLVEDDVISQHLTMRLLKSVHSDAETAATGRDALAKMSTIKYDLILMDINLPDTNGIYIVSQTQNDTHLNHNTPIIMLTGNKKKQTVADALKHGAKGYIVKPLTKSTIEKVLDKHIVNR